MRILYVEDNEVNQALVARVTRIQNHELVFCSEGEQALEMLAKDPDINLVLMDIELAGVMTGLDVVSAMRARNDKRPVVAVTAYAMMGDREKMLDAGCDQYLPKPLQIPDLLTVFSEYAARLEAGETLSAHTAEPAAAEPAAPAVASEVKESAAATSAPAPASAPAPTSAPAPISAPESPSDGTSKEAAEASASAEAAAPEQAGTPVQVSTAAEAAPAKESAPASPSTPPGNGTSAPSVTPAQALNETSLATSPSTPAED